MKRAMGTKRGWWRTAIPLAVPLAGLLSGCATQQDMLEQDRKLTNMIEQQSRSVDAMRKDLEQIRNDMGRGRAAPARTAPRPVTKPKAKPEDTTLLPPGAVPGPGAPGSDIGMTLSPEGESREDAPVAETVVGGGAQSGSTAPAPTAAPAAGGGLVGEAVAATPPPGGATAGAAPRGAADPEWRREVAQERAVARATGGGAEQQKYVDALQGLEQGDCKKALARLKAASGSGGSLSDNAMYWQA